MTESKLLVLDAVANKAILEAASSDEDRTRQQAMDDLEAVLGQPAKTASSLIPRESLKAPKVTDARAPSTLARAGLALLDSAADPDPEVAVMAALARSGLTKEMLPQMMESSEWASVVTRICQQYIYVTHFPKIVSAQVRKATLGDSGAAKLLVEMFGKAAEDGLDEQTKALAHADPATVIRSIDAEIEHLSRVRADLARSGIDKAKLKEAKESAMADLRMRRTAR